MREPTRGERREAKRRNARKMRVSGRSVLGLQEIIQRRAAEARQKSQGSDAPVEDRHLVGLISLR